MKKCKFPAILGMLAGVLAMIMALMMFGADGVAELTYADTSVSTLGSMDTGVRTSYSYYGGDAYTGMQQASADTARNVKLQSEIILSGFKTLPSIAKANRVTGVATNMDGYASILLCLGLGMVAFFGYKLCEAGARASFETKVLAAKENEAKARVAYEAKVLELLEKLQPQPEQAPEAEACEEAAE